MGVPFLVQLPDGLFGGVLGFGGVFMILLWIACTIYAIAVYALYSLGLYGIGKRRGIRNSWLAWLPIGNVWVLGSISDQFQYVVNGRECNRRKILLRLTMLTLLFSGFSGMCNGIASLIKLFHLPGADILLGAAFAVFLICAAVLAVVGILLTVYEYIALFDLYRSCKRAVAIPFIILSVVFSFLIPFLVFAVRQKDEGMTPKTEDVTQVFEETPAAIEEDTREQPE